MPEPTFEEITECCTVNRAAPPWASTPSSPFPAAVPSGSTPLWIRSTTTSSASIESPSSGPFTIATPRRVIASVSAVNTSSNPERFVPSTTTTGTSTHPGCVDASRSIAPLISGKEPAPPVGVIVHHEPEFPGSPTGMLKWIVSADPAFVSSMDARSVHSSAPSTFVPPVSQIPSPGSASDVSPVEFTTSRGGRMSS